MSWPAPPRSALQRLESEGWLEVDPAVGHSPASRSDRCVQYPVPGPRLQPDLARCLELRGIRVPRALAFPEVKMPAGSSALLRSLAPVAGRKGCRPPATTGRSRSGHRASRESAGAHGRRSSRSAWSARAATNSPSTGPR